MAGSQKTDKDERRSHSGLLSSIPLKTLRATASAIALLMGGALSLDFAIVSKMDVVASHEQKSPVQCLKCSVDQSKCDVERSDVRIFDLDGNLPFICINQRYLLSERDWGLSDPFLPRPGTTASAVIGGRDAQRRPLSVPVTASRTDEQSPLIWVPRSSVPKPQQGRTALVRQMIVLASEEGTATPHDVRRLVTRERSQREQFLRRLSAPRC